MPSSACGSAGPVAGRTLAAHGADVLLADGSLYAIDAARATALAKRHAELDDELLAAMERWEALGGG